MVGKKSRGTPARIVRKGLLAEGEIEGNLYDVEVEVLGKNGRTRKVKMLEKEFLNRDLLEYLLGVDLPELSAIQNIRRPTTQFNTMVKLMRLNREKKLGLHILPTIRLRKRKGHSPTLILTKLNPVVLNELQTRQVFADVLRQGRILRIEGYSINLFDSFFAQIDSKGNGIAVIFDFGNVLKIGSKINR